MRWVLKARGIKVLIGLLVLIWLLRVLAFDSFTILSPAGKSALQPGDNILISKIHFGARLPITPLGLPFSRQYLPFSACKPSYIEAVTLPYYRISGLTKIRRGDLLAYNFPEGDSTICGAGTVNYYSVRRKKESEGDSLPAETVRYRPVDRRSPEVSRCTGLPGDTLVISAGHLSHSLSPSEPSPSSATESRANVISFDYLVEMGPNSLSQDFFSRLGLGPSDVQILPGLGYLFPLRHDQVSTVRLRPEVNGMTPYFLDPDKGDYNIFPHDARFPWNRDNFGPVIVPAKGASIRLTTLNLSVYRRIIEVYERNKLEIIQNQIFINGSPADTYTFKQDYFFVLGDSRHHSRDSRHWGFLPADHIIGKPVLIWFSANRFSGQPLKIYWNRLFKLL